MSEQAAKTPLRWTPAVVLRFVLNIGLPLIFGAAAFVALDWQMRASILPLTVTGFGLVLGILNLVLDYRRLRSTGHAFVNADRGDVEAVVEQDPEEVVAAETQELFAGLRYFGWMLAYIGVMWVAGARVASAAFLIVFFRFEGKQSWRFALIGAVGAVIAITAAQELLNLRMPRSMLGW
ncbi:MAG: hypothetical protein JJT89_07825 [Nitriliruptoraceae bacterium]|nr:hypothetical protein [Nitriliruptoraceae bacterium]